MKNIYLYVLISVAMLLGVASVIFFIVTEKTAKPAPFELPMPKQEKLTEKIRESDSTVTILLAKDDKFYCYHGTDKNAGTMLRLKEIGRFLSVELKKRNDMTVLIKPSAEATYKNTVDILDQMTTNHVRKYKMVQPLDEDMAFIENIKK
ncbi:MAG: biopolymer transporter ExbD [Bacteroidota bacterium]|nr:biopolymer transporter ExbD [Bacteroidota bacterium]